MAPRPTASPSPAATSGFEVDAKAVVRAVRRSFAQLLTAAGLDPTVPQVISRRIGLNKNLAWKISKVVGDEDPAVVLQQMPGPAGIRIFFEGLERAGATEAHLQSARSAVDAYDNLIRTHCGDRASLDTLSTDLSPAGRAVVDEQHRKLLFQGGGHVWGVQARLMLKLAVIKPSDDGETLDLAHVSGLFDFRRLRQRASWAMASRHWKTDRGSKMNMPLPEPVDPRFAGVGEAPLMADFCSNPLPTLIKYEHSTGATFELPEGPIGNTAAIDCVIGTVQRGVPKFRTDEDEWGEHNAICDTPAEQLIYDLFIHESMTFAHEPEALLLSDLRSSMRYPGRDRSRDLLPLGEALRDLGQSDLAPATPEWPRYGDLNQYVFDRLGWKPSEFLAFRIKVAYPVCPSSLVLRYPLPPCPA